MGKWPANKVTLFLCETFKKQAMTKYHTKSSFHLRVRGTPELSSFTSMIIAIIRGGGGSKMVTSIITLFNYTLTM